MSRPPGDFEEFVAARWRELYAVATVTAGDPGSAARATASVLATLGRQWRETTDAGAPTAAARAAVLTAALAAADRAPAHPRDVPEDDEAVDDDARTRAALAAVVAEAPPTARAALAAQQWWGDGPALVAAGTRTAVADVRVELSVLERRLAAAHAARLGRDEHELAWALPQAVADTLEHAVDAAPVADPLGLVDAQLTLVARRHRTRFAVTLAGVAVAVTAVPALAWPGPDAGPATGPGRDDPTWASVSTWSPRGTLVDDPTVASIAATARTADPAARLLYAGPVGDTLTVVMTTGTDDDPSAEGVPGPALGEGFDTHVLLRLWTAPARLGAGSLTRTAIDGDATARTPGLVAVSVVQDTEGAPPAVLVLAPPRVTSGSVVIGSRPQPDGSLLPVVDDLALVAGVATYSAASAGFPPLLVMPGYEGPAAGAVHDSFLLPPSGPAAELAGAQRTLLSGVTGHSPDSLATTSVLEAEVPASALDPDYVGSYPDFVGTRPEPLRVTVVTTRTPDGGRVRTSRLAGSVTRGPSSYLEGLAAVPATDPHALLALPAGDHARFVAVAPDGATAQLVTLGGRLRDSATVRGGLATLASEEEPPGVEFRLRVLAPDGHIVYDAVPPVPADLLALVGGRA